MTTQLQDAPVDVDQLLFSKRVKAIHRDPFVHFTMDDYLPAEFYRTLRSEFPSAEWFESEIKDGRKRHFETTHSPEKFEAFCRQSPAWKRFVDFLRSPAFVNDLQTLVRPSLRATRGWTAARPWQPVEPKRQPPFWRLPVTTDFQFSWMERSSYIHPHSDAGKKLASILFYLPPEGWKSEFEGSTRFFRGRDGAKDRKWRTWKVNMVPKDRTEEFYADMEPFLEFDYKPNRVVLFLKSDCTFHDVQSLQCPEGMVRASFNMNINLA